MTNAELTYAGVLFAVLANQLCLPVPSVVFLMAAGALCAHGKMFAWMVVCCAVVGCLAGDGMWFWFGRKWGSKAMRVLCRFSADPRNCSKNAHGKFRRYGLWVLCGSKFVPGLDAVMPPLAGSEGVPVAGFLALDLIGSFLWSSSYVGLGYLFANELEFAIHWVQHFGTVLSV
jgi:membrane protein DedA with SNARE-associated domain